MSSDLKSIQPNILLLATDRRRCLEKNVRIRKAHSSTAPTSSEVHTVWKLSEPEWGGSLVFNIHRRIFLPQFCAFIF